jgi:2,4-dienoyl-CoA reductase-like NADH-dependent reductase (Old Yellow Enzyme family)
LDERIRAVIDILFEKTRIRGMEIRNRFVRSATFEGMGTCEGKPTRALKDLYFKLAEGEVGLIVTGLTHVDGYKNLPDIPGLPFPLAFDSDSFIDAWEAIITGVHQRGAKIALQITHLGRQDIPQLREPTAPSPIPLEDSGIVPRELTGNDIIELVEKFAQACRRAKSAGFDAVQLHGCHGYLISSFLSPHTNIRSDRYGGSTENRARLVMDILKRSVELVGPDFPLFIKMNGDDFIDGGLHIEEAVAIARLIVNAGIACIEMSGGIYSVDSLRISATGINEPSDEAYFRHYAEALKKQVPVPVILVGGNRSCGLMAKLVSDGVTDFIAMSRPFIREPGLIKRWKSGDWSKSTCISCNKCRENMAEYSLRCHEAFPAAEK